ncbi:hypothetical protein HOLleu_26311 [Holothuria leucospilota]|uniref:ZU5 domain-containing protein n=1 Tax=Holothuria leucospilota TaxID=206669 RepID=A0A9Q1BU62_HOLLE|nr:hypothetical protein HOLleu_26311 [Holothuria leucospilota]
MPFIFQAFQTQAVLTIEATISNEGGLLEIEETDITLLVPPNALEKSRRQRVIQMRVIPYGSCGASTSFSSNSSVIVELLPNDLRFQRPVELTLPHCLQLKKDVKYKAKVFTSYREQGAQPSWKEVIGQKYVLEDKTCTIWLERFSWVKYEIDDGIVEAKRIKIYTAAKPICVPDDIAEVVVGYHLDLPGTGEVPLI